MKLISTLFWDLVFIFLGILIYSAFTSNAKGFDDTSFLAAIAIVETGGDNSAVGKAGERSQYQFMRATWDQYARVSHAECAKHPDEIERVANLHLNWIKKTLAKNRMQVNVENCAAVWNAGWGNFKRGFRPHKYINKVKTHYRE